MSELKDLLCLAHRYESEGREHYAWPFPHVKEVIQAIAEFGRNLFKLFECEPDEPISGDDINGIRYLFGPCAEDYRDGRRLFDEAERLCAHADVILPRVSSFLDAELRKRLGVTEHGTFKIVTFSVGYDDWEMLRTFVHLGQVEAEPDYLLWGYWKVELEDLEPTCYCGFLPTASRPFTEPGED